MVRVSLIYFLLFFLTLGGFGQSSSSEETIKDRIQSYFTKPKVGAGVGIMTFFGDVGYHGLNKPFKNRTGLHLSIENKLINKLKLGINFNKGQVYGDEKNIERNLNFQSSITSLGANVKYVFGQRNQFSQGIINPYVSIGLEFLNFYTKGDLTDANGETYQYWSDGTIRNIAEKAGNSDEAVIIHRDYEYETVLRNLNLDQFGRYPFYSISVPAKVGMEFILSPTLSLEFSTALHYTYTDMIDNVNENSIGARKGNSWSDIILFSLFSAHYNLSSSNLPSPLEENYESVDFDSLDKTDGDNDGVPDIEDLCQETPEGVAVTKDGCARDTDFDGIPDYQDEQINSSANAVVNAKGIEITDSMIIAQYMAYSDSGNYYAKTKITSQRANAKSAIYKVQIATYKDEVPKDFVGSLLSIRDLESIASGNATIYSAGAYENIRDAVERKNSMINQGFSDAVIIEHHGNRLTELTDELVAELEALATKKFTDDSAVANFSNEKKNAPTDEIAANERKFSSGDDDGLIFRIQIGAYKVPVPREKFTGVKEVIQIPSEDNLTKYVTGSFDTYENAAAQKVSLISDGYKGAFVVAYKNGRRMDLNAALQLRPLKGPVSELMEEIQKKSINESTNKLDNKLGNNVIQVPDTIEDISYHVQLGSFKDEKTLTTLLGKQNFKTEILPNGIIRYLSNEFTSYEEASLHKVEMIKKGINGAFVVGYKDGQKVPLQDLALNIDPEFADSIKSLIDTYSIPKTVDERARFTYRIQLGVFSEDVSIALLKQILEIKGVEKEVTPQGLTRFVAGSFTNYQDAAIFRSEVLSQGIEGAFVITYKNGQRMVSKPSSLNVTAPDSIPVNE